MAIAQFKDLCIDSGPGETLGRFWSAALGLEFEPDESPAGAGTLSGPSTTQRIWMNVVPEPKSAKHRIHLDVHAASVEALVELGATVVEPATDGRRWTVMADPDGGEFCAFVRTPDALPDYRFYELAVDCADPKAMGAWWAGVLGATFGGNEAEGWYWVEDIPGLPFECWTFSPVPEPKTVKNRVHWDVLVDSVDDLVAAGAVLVRGPAPDGDWSVMTDPEGNEFCAFVRPA